MAALKYSRQRESIKKYLSSTKEHPTADMVYFHVKQEYPNISLGTVYRNLNLLTDLGEIVKISAPGRSDRFDGNRAPHNHFVCTCCGKILDVKLNVEETEAMNKAASLDCDGIIESSSTIFYGKCNECLQNL